MKRTFIHDPGVTEILADNYVEDDNLREVEKAIMRGGGATVSGTGGLKKIRCGSSGRGKSGSVRIIFADYPRAGRTYLLAAFGKAEQANVSAAERAGLRSMKLILDLVIEGEKDEDA